MHHRIRRVLSLLFLLTFLIAAPALIISTAGYRYDFLKGRIERTGVLFVSSKPSSAQIVLNGGETGKTTPSRVRRLLPGSYDVQLLKDGHHPWSRRIGIASSETTFLNNIVLFLDGIPELVLDAPVSRADFSPDRRYAAVQTETDSHTELRILDLRTGVVTLPYRTENVTGAALETEWSPDSTRLLMIRRSTGLPVIFLWDRTFPEAMTNLIEIAPALYETAFWSQGGRFLHAVAEGTMYAIDVRNRTAAVNGPSAEAMRIIDSTVFGVYRDAEKTTLVRRGLQDQAFAVLGEIPAGDYRHITGHAGRIALHDRDASRIIIIDPSTAPNRLVYHELRADEAEWSATGILLFRNGLELHTFDPSDGSDRLVTRLGGDLGPARWYPEIGLVLYSNGQDAIMTESSTDPNRNLTVIARFDRLDDIAIGTGGQRAWFAGSFGGQEGLWTLRLR